MLVGWVSCVGLQMRGIGPGHENRTPLANDVEYKGRMPTIHVRGVVGVEMSLSRRACRM